MNVIKEVEKELNNMKLSGTIDPNKIKALKEKLMLKTPRTTISEFDPTIETITKHRR